MPLDPYTESERCKYLIGSKVSYVHTWIIEKCILNYSKGSGKENATKLLVMISHTSLQQLALRSAQFMIKQTMARSLSHPPQSHNTRFAFP